MEPVRDSLERLVFRIENLMDVLEEKRVKVPLWPLMTLQRALELATEQQENLDEEKEAVLDSIRQVWYSTPYDNLRLGQLIMNLESAHSQDLYSIEDDELVERLGRVYGNMEA